MDGVNEVARFEDASGKHLDRHLLPLAIFGGLILSALRRMALRAVIAAPRMSAFDTWRTKVVRSP
jgi:hypothetical protein